MIINNKMQKHKGSRIKDNNNEQLKLYQLKMHPKNRSNFMQYLQEIRKQIQQKIKKSQSKYLRAIQDNDQFTTNTNQHTSGQLSRRIRNIYKLALNVESSTKSDSSRDISKRQQIKTQRNEQKSRKNQAKDCHISYDDLGVRKIKLFSHPNKKDSSNVFFNPENGPPRQSSRQVNVQGLKLTSIYKKSQRLKSLPSINSKMISNQNLINSSRYGRQALEAQQEGMPKNSINYTDPFNFQQLFLKVSRLNREKRTTQQFVPVLRSLQQSGLFAKLPEYLALCLLRIGIYHELYPADVLYSREYDLHSVFVVLSGVIALINPSICMKKFLYAGETFGEQMLFACKRNKKLLETAKAVSKTYILQIKTHDFYCIEEQAKKLGFFAQFQRLQDELRNGFTLKNIARNQYLIDRQKLYSS